MKWLRMVLAPTSISGVRMILCPPKEMVNSRANNLEGWREQEGSEITKSALQKG